MKRQKGITLIALIITIIVLLILVGVTITMLTGENGILNQATKSTIETYHGTVKEQIILGADEYFTAKNVDGYKEDVIKYLLNEKSYTEVVDDYYRVKVEKVASTIKTGKGKTKAEGDIYVIEKENTTTAQNTKIASTVISDIKVADTTVGNTKYVLRYYEKENKSKDLLYLYANGTIENPNTTPDSNPDPDPTPTPNPIPDPQIPDPEPEKIDPKDGDTVISYVEDLVNLQTAVNGGETQSGKRFILNNDLDFTDINSYDPSDTNRETLMSNLSTNGFVSIGITESNQFEGEFYGNGHTIKNITIKISPDLGLFLYNKGKISSLTIETNNITPSRWAAAIALYNNGTITKCVNKSEINSQYASTIAGITAFNNGTVTECKNEANITGGAYSAGIIGKNSSTSDVINCKNTGTITAYSSYVSGIVACSENDVNISNCNNEGNIVSNYGGGYSYCGGILGDGNGTIENCTNNSTITAHGYNIGGIAGSGTLVINNCSNEGTINAESATHVGGILGVNTGAITINKCNNIANIYNATQYVGGIVGNTASSQVSGITSCYNTGNIEMQNSSNCSFVGGIVGDVVYNGVIIDSCYNTGNVNYPNADKVGGILGYGYSEFTMSNVYNTGTISGKMEIGGIVGSISSNSSINKAYNTGRISLNEESSSASYAGGIVGRMNEGTAINVYNLGEVYAPNATYVGGVAGYYEGSVSNAFNLGNVTGSGYVGGITGYAMKSLKNAYNVGAVTGNSDVGTVIAWANSGANSSENLYYLSSLSGNALGTFAGSSADQEVLTGKMVSKTEAEMKSQTFVDLLNTNKSGIDGAVNWKLDSKTGYPVLDFTVTLEEN